MVTAGHKLITKGRDRRQPPQGDTTDAAHGTKRIGVMNILERVADRASKDAATGQVDLNGLAVHLETTITDMLGKDERICDLFAETSDAFFLTQIYNRAAADLLTRRVINDRGENAFGSAPARLTLPTSLNEARRLLHPKSLSLLVSRQIEQSALITDDKKPIIKDALLDFEPIIERAINDFIQQHTQSHEAGTRGRS